MPNTFETNLGRQLVLDELFDLTLYRRLRKFARGEMATVLDQLAPIEAGHLKFWKTFFSVPEEEVRLDMGRRIKLQALILFCRVFREPGMALILEAIELHGIKKYLAVWERYKNTPLGTAVHSVLQDEFQHEDKVVSEHIQQRVFPERIRDIFLGLNDGLVEMLGAVSGFFAAFAGGPAVLGAAFTVAVAGALSMAAGAFMSVGSQREAEALEEGKRHFLHGNRREEANTPPLSRPISSAVIVGISYFLGALVPISPVFFGARNVMLSLGVSALAVILVSYILAFLSGMDVKHRIAINLIIIALAVSITYLIGTFAKAYFGLSL